MTGDFDLRVWHTILLVQFSGVEHELTLLDHFVVEFIPKSSCCELGSRKLRERAKVEAIDDDGNTVQKPEYGGNYQIP